MRIALETVLFLAYAAHLDNIPCSREVVRNVPDGIKSRIVASLPPDVQQERASAYEEQGQLGRGGGMIIYVRHF